MWGVVIRFMCVSSVAPGLDGSDVDGTLGSGTSSVPSISRRFLSSSSCSSSSSSAISSSWTHTHTQLVTEKSAFDTRYTLCKWHMRPLLSVSTKTDILLVNHICGCTTLVLLLSSDILCLFSFPIPPFSPCLTATRWPLTPEHIRNHFTTLPHLTCWLGWGWEYHACAI